MRPRTAFVAFVCLCLLVCAAARALSPESAAKNQPQAPFRIIGNVYYVGASDVASYLIATPQGSILLDGGFAETAPMIEAHIAALGFKLSDVKILINGHAHPNHAGGLAQLKRDSGAEFDAMAEEVTPLEHNGRGTFYRGNRLLFDSIKVDRVLHDSDTVMLGGTTLTAHLTAGHTPGCTTWTTTVQDGGKAYAVVFTCQMTLPDALLGNPLYPDTAKDFAASFHLLKSLPCDVFLAEHASVYGMQAKFALLQREPAANPFVDPAGYQAWESKAQRDFETQLAAERKALPVGTDSPHP